ncbi:hypothetical protein KUCAC02_025257 [Chaenocephalus aceratus]|nr:hypothetical protein KUCAC02_025257 [Chaenocephalus aceratus]
MYNVFPRIVEHLPGSHNTAFAEIEEIKEFVSMQIQEHKETMDPSSPRDFSAFSSEAISLFINTQTYRKCSMRLTLIPHYALHDISFRGYTIPKDTVIIPLLHSVLKEEKHWETPWTFNPKHFLDQNDNFKKNPSFMPFLQVKCGISARKRACAGESLARMELFIFLVSLLQNFTFSCTGGPDTINLNSRVQQLRQSASLLEIIATPR